MKNRKQFVKNIAASSKSILVIVVTLSIILTLFASTAIVPFSFNASAQPVGNLDPLTIPKYTNQLAGAPPVYTPTVVNDPVLGTYHQYTVDMDEQIQQVLPTVDAAGNPTGFGTTNVWGYGGQAHDPVTGADLGYILNSPGPSFIATKNIPTKVIYNNLIASQQPFNVDPTLHWANPNNIPMPVAPFDPTYPSAQSPVPLVPHLHGGEIQSTFDGGPDAWWTSNGIHGPGYNTLESTNTNSAVYWYENINPETTLWYHDHALGITRLNVMSGLAGFYLLQDPAVPVPGLPGPLYDIPLAIQDRSFLTDGQFNFPADPTVASVPDIHPYWVPEFFGDTIMVNGLVWPNMNVDQGVYRFRLLDGSNARFYTLSFVTDYGLPTEATYPFTQIATDGGYMETARNMFSVTFAPGERVEILFDFSGFAPGTTIIMKNTANENFPFGAPINPDTVGQIMQFTVTGNPGAAAPVLPNPLNPTLVGYPNLPAADTTTSMTLIEVLDPAGAPVELLLDGQKFVSPASEIATVGSIEEWQVVNPTADSHPIHTHLVTMQVIGRQDIDIAAYMAAWEAANGLPPLTNPTVKIDPTPYLVAGTLTPPDPSETGWKDTVMMHPNQVTFVRMRFAPADAPLTGVGSPTPGVNLYPFNPSMGPGYVWHCHILDHEDNEMMRPLLVNTFAPPPNNIAPETTANLYGTLANGVYTSDVTVELIATRNTYRLDHIEYSFDNIHWIRYYMPFVVTDPGTTTVYYRTFDTEGYADLIKSVSFDISSVAFAFDFGTAGSPVAAGYTQVTGSTAYSAGSGYGWASTAGLGSRDRGAPDDLRRDLVFSGTDNTFNVDLPTGDYDVSVIVGDNSFPHDQIDISAEGTPRITGLNAPKGMFQQQMFTVTVNDGQLNLLFHDAGGADANWVINAITVSPASAAKTYDFGTANSPIFNGYTPVTQTTVYSAGTGYGWDSATGLQSRDRTAPDDFRRDFVFASVDRTFNVDLANGAYSVTVVIGDNNFPHDLIEVSAEGTIQVNQIIVPKGTFYTQTFSVTVSDGQLNLLFHDAGGADANWVINAITVVPN